MVPPGSACDTSPIIVEASADGLAAANISIPVSADAAKDSPFAVARASVSTPFTYLDTFVG